MENGTISDGDDEKVFMTPLGSTKNSTTILVEIKRLSEVQIENVFYKAGGPNTGIWIQKQIPANAVTTYNGTPHASIEFKVFLVNQATQKHVLESRALKFWFRNNFDESGYARSAQEFFKLVVSPIDFPRDYNGYIMKTLKLLHNGRNPEIRAIILELVQLEEFDTAPQRPLSADDGSGGAERLQLNETKVLEMIESAYPNPLTLHDISIQSTGSEDEVLEYLTSLKEKGLIKAMDNNAYTRVVQNERSVKIVNQMPLIGKKKQPSIAIITAQYCEKLAVDAMIEDQETFVRYTTVGESNVYTLGTIGHHRVVSTKLPSVGHAREAMIAAGNTTTRLLGTFQKVDFVFLVGVGGGVPHFTDYNKHVRLGDLVVGAPDSPTKPMYLYCEKTTDLSDGKIHFETKGWTATSNILQRIARTIVECGNGEWEEHYDAGFKSLLQQESDFSRPPASSDRLYMAIGDREVIEVAHPTPLFPCPDKLKSVRNESRVHLGVVAAGRQIARDDHTRQEIASKHGILAFDSEFDAVVESVIGNCREAFIVIRGISDYKDGTRRRDWQPHAALLAASFTKSLILRMDPPEDA